MVGACPPRRSWKFFQSIIRLWTVRDLWRCMALFSRIFSMCLRLLGAKHPDPTEDLPPDPAGGLLSPDPPPPLSKFLATPLAEMLTGYWIFRNNLSWSYLRWNQQFTRFARTSGLRNFPLHWWCELGRRTNSLSQRWAAYRSPQS